MKTQTQSNSNMIAARGKDSLVGTTLMTNGIIGFSKTIRISEVTGAAAVEYDFGDFKPSRKDLVLLNQLGVNVTLNNPEGTIKSAGFSVLERKSGVSYTNLFG
jgi:hypothetical protein